LERGVLKVLSALAAALVLIGPARVSAQERSRAPRRAIEVFVAAEARERQELESVIRELVGRLGVDVRITRVARVRRSDVAAAPKHRPGTAALAWVDARTPAESTLYVVDPAADRVLVRRVVRTAGNEELAREELGHILEAAIEGLLGGESIGAPRREVFPAAVPPPRPSRREPRQPLRLEVGALYEVQRLSDEAVLTQGPLASLFLRSGGRGWRFGAWSTAQYRQPLHVDSELVGARFQAGALRLLATADAPLSGALRLRAALGGGLDVVHVEPESREPERARAAGSETSTFAVARAAAGIDLELTPWASLWAFVALDVDPSDTSYVFVSRRGDVNVMTPAPLRPAALLGLSFR
jgi:hypothetical protein